jgi:transcriptional regulator with XRE-family HTH domain
MQTKTNSNKAAMNLAVILSAICEHGNTKVAEAIGRDAAYVSRLKNGERTLTLEEFANLLAATDLEVADISEHTITIERQLFESLSYLAKIALKNSGVLPSAETTQ